jgi:hypothetical protein
LQTEPYKNAKTLLGIALTHADLTPKNITSKHACLTKAVKTRLSNQDKRERFG